MRYEWNEDKAASNIEKHGIDFADAVTVFSDSGSISIREKHSEEERYVTIGADAMERLLVVVFTWRGETTIRVISARRVTRAERRQYEENYER